MSNAIDAIEIINAKRKRVELFEMRCRAEVERLRAAGELRVACPVCAGSGKIVWATLGEPSCDCYDCNGTGWKWSEER